MSGSKTSLPQTAFFDEYVDLVPVKPGRRVTFIPEAGQHEGVIARHALIVFLVVIPTVLAAIYFFVLAADRYESEARFSVRRSGAGASGPLSELLQASGPVRATDEAYAVEEYVLSRDAMNDLVANDDLDQVFRQAGTDPWWSFPSWLGSSSNEAKFRFYRRLVSVTNDSTTGVSTIRVEAFRPEDAYSVATALLDGAERMINRLNERAAADALAAVEQQAAELKQRLEAAQSALVGFRSRQEIIDPARLSITVLQTIALLTVQIAEMQASVSELQATSPRNPQIQVLQRRITAIEGQIALERRKLGGDDEALAGVIAEYESLMLEREFSQRAYSAALAAVEMTKSDNRKQRVYVERVVQPQLPDEAHYPYRFLWVLVVFVISLVTLRVVTIVRNRRAIMSA
jgi:capsular polysaccharide transport system permease protein